MSGMISNGYLFDARMVRTAVEEWALQRIQITLDGTEKIYNETKNYRNSDDDPYERVQRNIRLLLEADIRVIIRINLGKHNQEDVKKLIGELYENFHQKKQIEIYVHMLYENEDFKTVYDDKTYRDLKRLVTDLNIMLMEMGMGGSRAMQGLRVNSCMADSVSSILINPDGELGKCEHSPYQMTYGAVDKDVVDDTVLEYWRTKAEEGESCYKCPLYPGCIRLLGCKANHRPCVSVDVEQMIREIQCHMMKVYTAWRKRLQEAAEAKKFRLKYEWRFDDSDEMSVVFFERKGADIVKTIRVNPSAVSILTILQEECSFQSILDVLRKQFDTSGFPLEDIVEEYLKFLVSYGLVEIY